MVTDNGFLGVLMRSFGKAPSQQTRPTINMPHPDTHKGYMSEDAYRFLLNELQHFENHDLPRILKYDKDDLFDNNEKKLLNNLKKLGKQKQITPPHVVASLEAYVKQMLERTALKVIAKRKEDKEIVRRDRIGEIRLEDVKSRTHTDEQIIEDVAHLIDELSARMAALAGVDSRGNVEYRVKQKAAVEKEMQACKQRLKLNQKAA